MKSVIDHEKISWAVKPFKPFRPRWHHPSPITRINAHYSTMVTMDFFRKPAGIEVKVGFISKVGKTKHNRTKDYQSFIIAGENNGTM